MKTKMKFIGALKVWVVIYPSITVLLYAIGQSTSEWLLYQKTLLLTLTLVPWMVFIGLPFVNFMIELFSKNQKNANL